VLKEIMPHVQNDPEYLEKQKIVATETPKEKDDDPREVSQSEIDWFSLTDTNFPYRFTKGPGPDNPLGTMKFMFPNRFSVYLHGTQDDSLFSRQIRTFSHGCIRVEKPLELATYLLKDDWLPYTEDDLLRLIAAGEEKEIRLPEPIKIHLFYRTAWVGDDGAVHFRQDVYGWDKPLMQALQGLPVQWPLPKTLETTPSNS
jgi:murein L,D-transpeptidase YcbB/YkuD